MSTRHQIARTDEEIDHLCGEAQNNINEGLSRFSGQSYEEGIVAAIDWLIGATEDHPYPEE